MDSSSESNIPTALSLFSLFVFNGKFAGKREEDDYLKILYFWPPTAPLDQQCKQVGLAEALTLFSKDFSSNNDNACEALLCDHRKHVFLEVEPGYWMVLVANMHQHRFSSIEQLAAASPGAASQSQQDQSSSKIGYYNSDETRTYGDQQDVSFRVLKNVLKTLYGTFRLFNGCLERTVLSDGGLDVLRAKLQSFVSRYVEQILLPEFPFLNVFDALDGIDFLPVDPGTFLKIQSLVNHCKNEFTGAIKGAVVYFDKYLVFSGLTHEETRLVTRYVPVLLLERMNSGTASWQTSGSGTAQSSQRNSTVIAPSVDGKFLTGPENMDSSATRFSAPRVFLGKDEREHCVIAYQLQRMHVFFIVESEYLVKLDFYTGLHTFISDKLLRLMKLIADGVQQISSFNETYKYIYYNHMNLAIKSSIKKKSGFSPDAMQAIQMLHSAFDRSNDGLKEIYIKVKKDGWVIGKTSGRREFFVAFEQKNYTLFEVNEQVMFVSSFLFGSPSTGNSGSTAAAGNAQTGTASQ